MSERFSVGQELILAVPAGDMPAEFRGCHACPESGRELARVIARPAGQPPCEMSVDPATLKPSSAAHTPGPWSWEYHPDNGKPIALSAGDTDVLLATGDGAGKCWLEVGEADARLIEAAPKLLAQAEAILHWAMAHGRAQEGSELLEILSQTSSAVRHARKGDS